MEKSKTIKEIIIQSQKIKNEIVLRNKNSKKINKIDKIKNRYISNIFNFLGIEESERACMRMDELEKIISDLRFDKKIYNKSWKQ